MTSALILVDIQNDYFSGGNMELSDIKKAALNAKYILSFFREKNLPVIHIKHISKRPGASFFLPETKGAEINDMVMPNAGEKIIIKNSPNAFLNTDLYDYLKDENVSEVIICGAMSNMCIDATTRAASDAGFSCTVIADGCAAKSLEYNGIRVSAEYVHTAFMAALSGIYAKVTDTDSFLKKEIPE